ncbi:sensor histidine kinase [Micromonospora sp. DT228]|uniref:sensor histidine kinase n=1 Tax=Micromonospora sp. DT228 TaxID=3393443 RepID=UPI003CF2C167
MRSGRALVGLTTLLTIVFAVPEWRIVEEYPLRAIPLLLANTLPVLAIRWNPVAIVLVFGVTYPLWLQTPIDGGAHEGHFLQSLPLLVALYAAGAWRRPLWQRAIALITPLWMMAAVIAGQWPVSVTDLLYVAVVCGVVWALGVAIDDRQRYAEDLEVKAEQLRAAQQALAERAIADERSRIARELHDVIAHAMSVITVQAGVGAHLVAARPAQAAEALTIIERTGREALSELRRMLTVLRDPARNDQIGPAPAPQPGLADVPSLVAAAGDAGVAVTVAASGPQVPLPPGLDLAAYRVVQESLTNVIKHAPGVRAQLTISYQPDRLTVEVQDPGAADPAYIPGQGLRGMAERVALYDGELSTAGGPDGFRVTATFPLEAP